MDPGHLCAFCVQLFAFGLNKQTKKDMAYRHDRFPHRSRRPGHRAMYQCSVDPLPNSPPFPEDPCGRRSGRLCKCSRPLLAQHLGRGAGPGQTDRHTVSHLTIGSSLYQTAGQTPTSLHTATHYDLPHGITRVSQAQVWIQRVRWTELLRSNIKQVTHHVVHLVRGPDSLTTRLGTGRRLPSCIRQHCCHWPPPGRRQAARVGLGPRQKNDRGPAVSVLSAVRDLGHATH